MPQFVTNKETRRLDVSITRHFIKRGWKVTNTSRNSEPMIEVTKRDISLLVKSIDADLQLYIGILPFLDRLKDFSREYRVRTGNSIVYVFGKPLLGLKIESLDSHEIPAVFVENLDTLSNLENLYDQMPEDLSALDLLVIRGCRKFCIALSDQDRKKKNFLQARRWLDLNLEGINIVLETHFKLIDLLVITRDFNFARDTALRTLAMSPYSVGLLRRVRTIELALGNKDAVTEIDERIAAASVIKPSFERMMEKQGISIQQQYEDARPIKKNKEHTSFLRRLFLK